MSTLGWIERLELSAIARNPILATKLRPGLSEARVRRVLSQGKVTGETSPIVALYIWKDGMDLTSDPAIPNFNDWKASRSFFAGKPYFFICLEMAAAGFRSLKAIAENYPEISEAIGRYFPIFSDGATEQLAIDVKPSNQNRVMIVDHRSDQPIREAYHSFDQFIADAIRANTGNKPLGLPTK
jgi:hypothetical protein